MVATVRELFQYQAHADASMLMAIQRHEQAAKDCEVLSLIHHVLIAHRFWVCLCQAVPFSVEAANAVPDSLEDMVRVFQVTQADEFAWMERLEEIDLARIVESPYLPGRKITIQQALIQVCLHSQGHRAQLAVKLRALGGVPPASDYILWSKDRPAASW